MGRVTLLSSASTITRTPKIKLCLHAANTLFLTMPHMMASCKVQYYSLTPRKTCQIRWLTGNHMQYIKAASCLELKPCLRGQITSQPSTHPAPGSAGISTKPSTGARKNVQNRRSCPSFAGALLHELVGVHAHDVHLGRRVAGTQVERIGKAPSDS